jgi:hypothetical protein
MHARIAVRSSQPCELARFLDKRVILPFKNILKKVKKKLVSPWHFPLKGNLARQTGRVAVQKYFKKSEKKACQSLKNSIIRAKT